MSRQISGEREEAATMFDGATRTADVIADELRALFSKQDADEWDIGRLLAEARDLFTGDREFGQWCSINFIGQPQPSLYLYRRRFEVFGSRRAEVSRLGKSVLYALAAPSLDNVRDQVVTEVLALENPDGKAVKAAIAAATGRSTPAKAAPAAEASPPPQAAPQPPPEPQADPVAQAKEESVQTTGKRLGWTEATQLTYRDLFGEVDLPPPYQRNNLAQDEEMKLRVFERAGIEYRQRVTFVAGGEEATRLAQAVRSLWLEENPEARKQQAKTNDATKGGLSKAKQREFEQLVNREMALLRSEGNAQLKQALDALQAEWRVKMDKADELIRQRQAEELRARTMREKTASVMPVEEWKQVVRLLHSDRYPEEYRANLDKAMGILRQRIEPALNQRPDPRPASSYADIHRRAEAAKNGRPH